MMNWNFNTNDYDPNKNVLIKEGRHRVRIINVQQIMAKNGNEGLEISLVVNGYDKGLKYFIWYNYNAPVRTNQLLGEFYNSFHIPPEDRQNSNAWNGKEGVVYVTHVMYKGYKIAKVSYCVSSVQQFDVPKWKEEKTSFHKNSDIETSRVDALGNSMVGGTNYQNKVVNGFSF